MATVVISAFVLGWFAMVCAFALLLTLAVRLRRRDKSKWPASLRRWHSIYSWPYLLLKADSWDSESDRRMVRLTRVSAAVSVASLSLVALAYGLLGGR